MWTTSDSPTRGGCNSIAIAVEVPSIWTDRAAQPKIDALAVDVTRATASKSALAAMDALTVEVPVVVPDIPVEPESVPLTEAEPAAIPAILA